MQVQTRSSGLWSESAGADVAHRLDQFGIGRNLTQAFDGGINCARVAKIIIFAQVIRQHVRDQNFAHRLNSTATLCQPRVNPSSFD